MLAELERLDAQRRAAADRETVRDLQRALRGFRKHLPQYDLPGVSRPGDARDRTESAEAGETLAPSSSSNVEPLALFPPGPIAVARVVPQEIRIAPGTERRVRGVATDQSGACIANVSFTWELRAEAMSGLSLRGAGAHPALVAAPSAPAGLFADLVFTARDATGSANAVATISVVDELPHSESLGVPEPHLVSDPDGRWRSRMLGERWEVNEAHPDYAALRAEPRARVRYLLALLLQRPTGVVAFTPGTAQTA